MLPCCGGTLLTVSVNSPDPGWVHSIKKQKTARTDGKWDVILKCGVNSIKAVLL